MTQRQFIELVIMNQIGDVVKLHPYLSFPLMATAIELLGSCIDSRPLAFDQKGESGKRFNLAIIELFPNKYHRFTNKTISNLDLYTMLRCGMLHQFLPKAGVHLGESKNRYFVQSVFNIIIELGHLSVHNGGLLLIAEELYKDLQGAAQVVVNRIDSGEIKMRFDLKV